MAHNHLGTLCVPSTSQPTEFWGDSRSSAGWCTAYLVQQHGIINHESNTKCYRMKKSKSGLAHGMALFRASVPLTEPSLSTHTKRCPLCRCAEMIRKPFLLLVLKEPQIVAATFADSSTAVMTYFARQTRCPIRSEDLYYKFGVLQMVVPNTRNPPCRSWIFRKWSKPTRQCNWHLSAFR
ncbi:hypothetical protein BD410DRAFT_789873 [Rickenella mellea]|uniref:Uncharacterized protein n=1 Tax=Rickenella mellea TaxID=50990 RepID=A0A4Y7Q2I3_9AGAM|nr:hypothetical protein BD410DRAFT_789873 [Rickenella mellea]